MPLEIGLVLDEKYRVVRFIGKGGMGAVFEGENVRVRRKVAIKVLHPKVASNQEAIHRFEREAQAVGRIGSDHILEIIDLGILPGGERYMVMEYLDGEPLSARIARQGRLGPHELLPLVRQVLTGLAAAHEAGIVHRDLKPDNIFIVREKADRRDFVKLIDFGISKIMPTQSGEPLHLTRTGAVMGTPYYLSPEQANGSRDVDARSDIYALGVILYEAITGRVPFDARSFHELLFQIVLAEPTPPQMLVPDADPAFCSIIMKAMARAPEARFQSCAELARAIEGWARSGLSVTIPPEFAASLVIQTASPGVSAEPMAAQRGALSSPQSFPGFVPGGTRATAYSARQRASVAIPGLRSGRRVLFAGAAGVALTAGMVLLVLALTRESAPVARSTPVTRGAASTSLAPPPSPITMPRAESPAAGAAARPSSADAPQSAGPPPPVPRADAPQSAGPPPSGRHETTASAEPLLVHRAATPSASSSPAAAVNGGVRPKSEGSPPSAAPPREKPGTYTRERPSITSIDMGY